MLHAARPALPYRVRRAVGIAANNREGVAQAVGLGGRVGLAEPFPVESAIFALTGQCVGAMLDGVASAGGVARPLPTEVCSQRALPEFGYRIGYIRHLDRSFTSKRVTGFAIYSNVFRW